MRKMLSLLVNGFNLDICLYYKDKKLESIKKIEIGKQLGNG